MNPTFNETECPRCGAPTLKSWSELSADEKLLAERLPASAEFSLSERKKHRFCTKCWYEDKDAYPRTV